MCFFKGIVPMPNSQEKNVFNNLEEKYMGEGSLSCLDEWGFI